MAAVGVKGLTCSVAEFHCQTTAIRTIWPRFVMPSAPASRGWSSALCQTTGKTAMTLSKSVSALKTQVSQRQLMLHCQYNSADFTVWHYRQRGKVR